MAQTTTTSKHTATLGTRDRIVVETSARRNEAEALLQTLIDAREASEKNLSHLGRSDLVKNVTGQSAIERAIASTRSMISSFDGVLIELESAFDDEDARLLDDAVRGIAGA